MSLLLKALKQAEAANAAKPGGDTPDTGNVGKGNLELEPVTASTSELTPDWVEPPGLLFGSNGLPPELPPRPPAFNWPRLSLVPLAALIAALVALVYGVYLYFELQPPDAPLPSPPVSVAPAPAAAPAIMPAPRPQPPAITTAERPADASPEAGLTATAPVQVQAVPSRPVHTASRASDSSRAAAPSAALPQFQPDAQTTLLSQAYAAYQRGALGDANRLYAQAASRSRSVDALLGLAAIASVQNREVEAQHLYREILNLDPRNATAQAALLDLLGNTDNQATESRLKTLIERDPSPQLYQTLGNLYADQGRWNDAQVAYFESYRGAPNNADYAFNLAVSLEQLRQFPAALAYYEKALSLSGAARFNRAQAEARVQQLKAAR